MNTTGLTEWIQNNVITVILLVIGAGILLKANKGEISKVVTIVGGALLGIGVIAIATGGLWSGLGTWIVGLLGVGNATP